VGATISKAGAERATPLATATLVIAANAPDIDVAAYTHGAYFALSFRRGITHGLPATLLLPFVVAAVVLGWDRWVRRRRSPESEAARPGPVLALSFVGLLTHPALDWMNTYGMRWLLPFDGAWTYGDALFIIDPWLWLGLGSAVFLATSRGRTARMGWGTLGLLTTLLVLLAPLPLTVRVLWTAGLAAVVMAAARGWPEGRRGRQRLAAALGVAAAVYIGAMVTSDVFAHRAVLRAAEGAGLEVRDLMVAPTPGNPLVAGVEVLTEDGFVPGTHRWLGAPTVELHPERMVPLRRGPSGVSPEELDGIVSAAGDVPDAHYWLDWARYPYVRVEPDGPGWLVTFRDARYDESDGAGELAGVTVRVRTP
jgi:inner membrane protein